MSPVVVRCDCCQRRHVGQSGWNLTMRFPDGAIVAAVCPGCEPIQVSATARLVVAA